MAVFSNNIKISNGNGCVSSNIAIGCNALAANTATNSVAIGFEAACTQTSGGATIAIGVSALTCNSTGVGNIGIGLSALHRATGGSNTVIGTNGASCAGNTGSFNTGVGGAVLRGVTTGDSNTAVGYTAGINTTTGCGNVILGTNGGYNITTGCYNVFAGISAGCGIVDGNDNIAIGRGAASNLCALGAASSGMVLIGACAGLNGPSNYATYIGWRAGRCATGGDFTVAVGACALGLEENPLYNTAVGGRAAAFTTTGARNTALGAYALYGNGIGSCNVALGHYAGYAVTGSCNTTVGTISGCNILAGIGNTALGHGSATGLTTGCYNVVVGTRALEGTTTGSYNTAVGFFAMTCGGTTASSNVALGCAAGFSTSGDCNVYLGRGAGLCATTGSNNVTVGFRSGCDPLVTITTASNRIVMGNDSHTCAQIKIAWTVVSDERDKAIEGPVPLGTEFVRGIEPITYRFINRETGEVTDEKPRYGLSAQNVLANEVDPEHGVIVSNDDPEKLKMTYEMLIPVLINSVKELDARLTALES